MLQTNLKHVTSEDEYRELLNKHDNVMICCGRMGPMCIPVYQAMIEMENDYPHIEFRDMAFDESVSGIIRNLPECIGFMGLPFTVYFRKGEVIAATSGIQSGEQVKNTLNEHYTGLAG